MDHKVHFVVAAFGKDCDDFTLHIYASEAEQERKMISERVKAAAAVQEAAREEVWAGASLEGGTTPSCCARPCGASEGDHGAG
jgi:DNA invertase Pin-like site-specific DNA recombinase